MSIFTYFQKNLFFKTIALLFLIILSDSVLASSFEKARRTKAKVGFIPPPIPSVNTQEFKNYVRKYHTFPSPYGFEPYRDHNQKEMTFLLNELNPNNPYIPVTFYCNTRGGCPISVLLGYGMGLFTYADQSNVEFGLAADKELKGQFIGYYFPDDPVFYTSEVGYHVFKKPLVKGDAIVTILFSQRVLQYMSEPVNNTIRGKFTANSRDIVMPFADGKEKVTVGTTLSLLGLGEASGVEFSETVSQTTGETYTVQVQTGFTINVGLEAQISVGGGVIPTSESFKFSVNESLSTMVSNAIAIANQETISRTYTIKPGINETYYWAIYQLLYSYRVDAPLLEEVLKQVQEVWGDRIGLRIAGNQVTQDGKLIGNPLPPQTTGIQNDVTVGVAVPVNPESKGAVFSQPLRALN